MPWHEDRAHLFYRVYRDAFGAIATRPTWPEATWRRALIESPRFRPDLSTLVLDDGIPAGYVICWVDPRKPEDGATGYMVLSTRPEAPKGNPATGYIAQVGVRSCSREQGFGTNLLLRAMGGFQADGLSHAMLNVHDDNVPARRLYERLGFRQTARLTVYSKKI